MGVGGAGSGAVVEPLARERALWNKRLYFVPGEWGFLLLMAAFVGVMDKDFMDVVGLPRFGVAPACAFMYEDRGRSAQAGVVGCDA